MNPTELLSQIEEVISKEYKEPDLDNKVEVLDEIIYLSLCTKSGSKNVNTAYIKLKDRFQNWDDALYAGQGEVAFNIRISGNAKRKARSILEILREIKDKIGNYNMEFLRDFSNDEARNWLVEIPNIGPKIANCVLLFCLGREVFPVDTHIERILKRLNLVEPKIKTQDITPLIEKYIPRGRAKALHVNLITHGRKVCRAHVPKCEICKIQEYCAYAGNHVLG